MNEWLIAAMFFKGEMPMNQWMWLHGGASPMALWSFPRRHRW
jgi:hypothetical protein